MDNGSLRPEAGLMTRRISNMLQQEIGLPVIAASLAHSDRIPEESLGGISIPLLDELLERLCERADFKEIWIVPFLLVTGGMIYQRIQATLKRFSLRYPQLSFDITDGLVSESDPLEESIAGLIAEQVHDLIDREKLLRPRLVMVDHGSPDPSSARVRNHVSERLASILGDKVDGVVPASMERREGPEYDFNEPLLERALVESVEQGHLNIVLARLFLQPGRHNGRGGDVDCVCDSVTGQFPETRILSLPRIFSEKRLVPLLKRRLKQLSKIET